MILQGCRYPANVWSVPLCSASLVSASVILVGDYSMGALNLSMVQVQHHASGVDRLCASAGGLDISCGGELWFGQPTVRIVPRVTLDCRI